MNLFLIEALDSKNAAFSSSIYLRRIEVVVMHGLNLNILESFIDRMITLESRLSLKLSDVVNAIREVSQENRYVFAELEFSSFIWNLARYGYKIIIPGDGVEVAEVVFVSISDAYDEKTGDYHVGFNVKFYIAESGSLRSIAFVADVFTNEQMISALTEAIKFI